MEAAPAFTQNQRYYALYLLDRGRGKQAVEVVKQALVIDPRGLATNLALATTYYWSGQLDAAVKQLKETLALDDASSPSMSAVHEILSDVYESKGEEVRSIAEREQALRLNDLHEAASELHDDFKRAGFREAMSRFYRRQLEGARFQKVVTYVSPVYFAILHIHLGEFDEAFEWLQRAKDERAPWLLNLRADPAFAPIRSDPRFEPLAGQVGIPTN
jgi:tetratricopeptide (TPR) repeat protein